MVRHPILKQGLLLMCGADDIQEWFHGNADFPAPIVAINEDPINSYLENFLQIGRRQDPDAFYNSLFWSPAHNTLEKARGANYGLFGGSGIAQVLYPGPETRLLFANGIATLPRHAEGDGRD